MTSHLTFLLLGLGAGAVIAALAMGLVVTYQASGVVNFAHAALGTYCAFAFYQFRVSGLLVLPVIGLPSEIDIGGVPTVGTAFVACIAMAALMGLFLALVVYRPLRTSSELARVVASLGVLAYLIGIIGLRFGAGATAIPIDPILPGKLTAVGSIRVPTDRYLLAAIVVAMGAVLWALSTYTMFGIRTRAVAENERGAVLLGIRADRVAVANWVLASVLAAAAMILAAPITRLNAGTTSLLVVPAIAAALVGSFSSIPIAVAAGLALGMVQSELLNLRTQWTWLPDIGLQDGLPLVVIIVVLIWSSNPLPARGALGSPTLPSARLIPHSEWIAAAATLGALVTMWVAGSSWRLALIVSAIAAIGALSVVIVTGFTGQINLAVTALAGVGAFTLVKLDRFAFPIGLVLAVVAACVVGIALSLPALRVRGLTLGMATLAGALAIQSLLFGWDWFTGGLAGSTIRPPLIGGLDLRIDATGADFPRRAFGLLVVAIAGLGVIAVARLRRTGEVKRWLAVRSNERAAAAIGINTTRVKVTAFAVSASLAGLAGGLLAYQLRTLSSGSFEPLAGAIGVFAVAYLAGIGFPLGAVVAGILANGGVLSELLGDSASEYQFAVNGALLVVAAIALPDGIVGRLTVHRHRRRRRSLRAAL
jgi:branched-chain amino acid transport system permease protein